MQTNLTTECIVQNILCALGTDMAERVISGLRDMLVDANSNLQASTNDATVIMGAAQHVAMQAEVLAYVQAQVIELGL